MNILPIIGTGAGIIALVAAGTLLLPRQIQVERQATLDTTPEAVIAMAASNKDYQRFNPYLTADPQLKIDHFGPDAGVGSGFRFDGKDGKGSQVVASVSDNSVRYDIDLGAMGKPTQTISAVPVSGGALVNWRMDMDLGWNPIARVFGLFMDGMIGKTFEQGLDNLDNVS